MYEQFLKSGITITFCNVHEDGQITLTFAEGAGTKQNIYLTHLNDGNFSRASMYVYCWRFFFLNNRFVNLQGKSTVVGLEKHIKSKFEKRKKKWLILFPEGNLLWNGRSSSEK